jgi:hypothetical protein
MEELLNNTTAFLVVIPQIRKMIDITAWRTAIGSWNVLHGVKNSGYHHYTFTILEQYLAAVCLFFILVIGGIELNPGPVLSSAIPKPKPG